MHTAHINNLKDFSVINTGIRIINDGGQKIIEKRITPNIALPFPLERLMTMTDTYIDQIQAAEIPLPEVKSKHIHGKSIVYACQYKGPNIIQLFTPHQLVFNEIWLMEHAIEVFLKACMNSVYIDPHPKNFVWNGKELYYVDFSPPYIDSFMKMRIEISKKEERSIIEDNFSYFGPEYLLFHFAGDFLSIEPDLKDDFFKKLYDIVIMITQNKIEFNQFIETAKAIRRLEDLRLSKGIYLL
jgi:hypothetical protein